MRKIICFCLGLYSVIAFAQPTLIYYGQYSENKNAFLKLAKKADPARWQTTFESWSVNADSQLTTDVAIFKQPTPQNRLIVLSSGIHGIEGYVGSAIQRWFLEKEILSGTSFTGDVALVHALNPWGMQNKRRVNADNIDLNRNFSSATDIFTKKNDAYMMIDSFLNPSEKADVPFFHRASFLFKSIRLIIRYGLETLRKSILLGQNQQPRGLYFSGQAPSALKYKIDLFMKSTAKNYTEIIWIDLHTGYGVKGKLHLLANDSTSPQAEALKKLFVNGPIDFGDQKNFYKTDGDLVNYLTKFSAPSHDVKAVVFEYGTLDSQSTLGSIESLRRMVLENQLYQNGTTELESKNEINTLFQDMFFPQDENWANQVRLATEKALLNLNLGH